VLAAKVEACRRNLTKMKEIDPQFRALVSAGASALWCFLAHAADDTLDKPDAWWHFVLAFLNSSGFPHEGLRQTPGRLKPQLDAMRNAAHGTPELKDARAGKY
jgi:hypothetical protein